MPRFVTELQMLNQKACRGMRNGRGKPAVSRTHRRKFAPTRAAEEQGQCRRYAHEFIEFYPEKPAGGKPRVGQVETIAGNRVASAGAWPVARWKSSVPHRPRPSLHEAISSANAPRHGRDYAHHCAGRSTNRGRMQRITLEAACSMAIVLQSSFCHTTTGPMLIRPRDRTAYLLDAASSMTFATLSG
jgi:hypothetical protein